MFTLVQGSTETLKFFYQKKEDCDNLYLNIDLTGKEVAMKYLDKNSVVQTKVATIVNAPNGEFAFVFTNVETAEFKLGAFDFDVHIYPTGFPATPKVEIVEGQYQVKKGK